jgi:hypothetical protein
MVEFIINREFVTHNSIHSVVGTVLIPWCYTPEPTPDDAAFREIAAGMTATSGYTFGQCPEILYTVSGGTIDWAYGEQVSKPKIFSVSTEVGGSGFWPSISEREGLLGENLPSMLYLTEVAGPTLVVDGLDFSDEDGDLRIEPEEIITLSVTLLNAGVVAPVKGAHLRLRCDDPYVRLLAASSSIDALDPGQGTTIKGAPFRFSVEGGCPGGRHAPFSLEVAAEGERPIEFPFALPIHAVDPIHANDFENALDEWILDETHTAEMGAFVRIDPNPTAFQPDEDGTFPGGSFAWVTGQNVDVGTIDVDGGIAASRSPDFDLAGLGGVRLSMNYFFGQRDGGDDPQGDYFSVDVSSDGGATWTNIIWIGDQASLPEWRSLFVDLQDLITLTDRVRLRVQASDGPVENDIIEAGIDAVELVATEGLNRYPGAPIVVAPLQGADSLRSWVNLSVRNALDPDGDPLRYGFRVFSDSVLTDLVASIDLVPEGSQTAQWTVPHPLELGTYYWRAFAEDPTQRGFYSPVARFTVTDTTLPPGFERALLTAGPNPARDVVRLRYRVPVSTISKVAVFDLQGRLIRRFPPAASEPGWHELEWDGKDDAGRSVAAGTYWIRLRTPRETRTLQVVRFR